MKRAVITGLGAVTPIGNTVNEYWENLIKGISGAGPITKFDTTNHKTKFACEVKDFDPTAYVKKNEVRKMDQYSLYALAAAAECIQDSAIDLSACDLTKAGVLLATGIGGMLTFEDEILKLAENVDFPRISPFFIPKMISNIAAGQISIKYGLLGMSYSMSSACASSNHAIGTALDLIRLGRAKVLLVGGSEATITRVGIGGFNSMQALSTNNDNPTQASRPFDKDRDGFVAGEGAGILMVEELEHALARGAKIYCELAGYSAASDAFHVVATHPDGLGAQLAMKGAMEDAGVQANQVDCISAHGTSTPVGDISEYAAIEKVFSGATEQLHVYAPKSMTGHLLGAAGAVESIACVKSIENDIVPPTINLDNVDEKMNTGINLTPNVAVKKPVNVVLNNTFGFGGHACTTLLKKYIA